MTQSNPARRILNYARAVTAILAVAFFTLIQNTYPATSLDLAVNTSPIELPLRETFAPREADDKTIAIVTAAVAFLDSLDATQRQVASYTFADNAQRANWPGFTEGMGGLKLRELWYLQQTRLDELLAEIFSNEGVLYLESQLAAERTFSTDQLFNKYEVEHLYVAFLGEPSTTKPWMFQFGGAHLAINVTVYGPDTEFSPMLTGVQPLHIQYEGEDVLINEAETTAAQALVDSLSDAQRTMAVRGDAAIDLLLGPGEFGTVIAPEGIKGSDLTFAQQQLLLDLIDTRLGFINDDDYATKMLAVIVDLDDTYFGWWGPLDEPGFAYFRVTGPSLILEYAPQDMAVEIPESAHAGSMYRNPQNDYGTAWIGADR